MRARLPDVIGSVEVDGISLGYEVFGDGEPTILLLPTWTIIHCRFWKQQIPYLARHFRVVTYDGPGNGRSDRPTEAGPYGVAAQAAHALAVMDATDTSRAVLVSLSKGALWSLYLSANHPDRLLAQVFLGPSVPLTPQAPERARIPETFTRDLDSYEGWEKYNVHYWRSNYKEFAEFFFAQCLSEPHSTKPREDCVGWAMETSPEVLLAEARTDVTDPDPATVHDWSSRVDSPVLVIHGDDDRVSPISRGEALAEITGGELLIVKGGGHIVLARDPVRVNLAIKEFIDRVVTTTVVGR